MKKPTKKHQYSTLINDLASFIEQGRKAAARYVNTALVATYWLIGWKIVEYEQKGKKRAEYGEVLLERLAKDLTNKFGKGFGRENLRLMRQFYLAYQNLQISQTVSGKLHHKKSQTVSGKSVKNKIRQPVPTELSAIFQTPSGISQKSQTLSYQSVMEISNTLALAAKFLLSWSHYCLLIRFDEPFKREFYEAECIRGNWSVRQLYRQIQSMLYERTALSKRKLAVMSKAHEKPIVLKPEDELKDPCSDKKQTIVEYALGGTTNKIFASKYKLKLPDPEVLKTEIERERQRLLEMKIVEE
jgi:predicted nuclease of restriction endonuclease-like (RecB) superfamily